jgi:hypothetical protein
VGDHPLPDEDIIEQHFSEECAALVGILGAGPATEIVSVHNLAVLHIAAFGRGHLMAHELMQSETLILALGSWLYW